MRLSHEPPVAYLGFGKGGPWRARRARAYNGGMGAEPQRGSGQSPWSGGQAVRRGDGETDRQTDGQNCDG